MNKARLAALSETELIDAVCEAGARNGMTHPDIHSLVTELAKRRGIHKRKRIHEPGQGTGPKKPVNHDVLINNETLITGDPSIEVG